jgi:hypothetical protein
MMFKVFVAAVVLAYGVLSWNGWELGTGKRGVIPREARQQSGGYRSYHFWRGGK